MNAIRKSLRKKKEAHHEIALKQKGKENKLEKVGSYIQSFDRSNWTESLQSLNSSHLEEEFLPGVVKQKKEQRKLHQMSSTSSLPTDTSTQTPEKKVEPVVGNKRRRSGSVPTATDFAMKPPIPRKKTKTPTAIKPTVESTPGRKKRLASEQNKEENVKQNGLEENNLREEEERHCEGEHHSSIASAEKLFAWLIGPVKSEQFFRWEIFR